MPHHFTYIGGEMHAEDVPLRAISEQVGTPVYVYSAATLERHYRVFSQAFAGLDALVCFAVKANSNIAVLKTLADLGAGADVVSGGELARALAAGIPSERIVFSGVGKTADEMRAALDAGIHQFNVESEPELELLSHVASEIGKDAPIAFRVNPDVDAKTHAKISTGKAENKFGIAWSRARSAYARAAALPGIAVKGVDVHIGSQLTELGPFREAFEKVARLVADLRSDGHAITQLDLGGGLGIPYAAGSNDTPPPPDDYGQLIADVAGPLGCQIILEPGRLIAGNAGVLLTTVLYVKEGEERKFVIVDAAMNDLIRPAMYDAHHDILPVRETEAGKDWIADIAGPVCETGDVFAKARATAPIEQGALAAIMSAGAYGAVLASTYNTRPLVPEVLVNGADWAVIRKRPSVEDLLALDALPPWKDADPALGPRQ
ncbi:MAG: diaminopimelate decarboxylase [Pseudomonadota bacterium]